MAIHLTFDRDKCKGCELCVSVCPKHILALDSAANAKGYRPAVCVDPAACTAALAAPRSVPIPLSPSKKTERGGNPNVQA